MEFKNLNFAYLLIIIPIITTIYKNCIGDGKKKNLQCIW